MKESITELMTLELHHEGQVEVIKAFISGFYHKTSPQFVSAK
nr:hypothetical protein [Streptococcus pseudopneumoniae]